jgi:hypothetical protein
MSALMEHRSSHGSVKAGADLMRVRDYLSNSKLFLCAVGHLHIDIPAEQFIEHLFEPLLPCSG